MHFLIALQNEDTEEKERAMADSSSKRQKEGE